MLRNIRLSGLRALKRCTISDLAHINVVCGRNNSGKSTVLEALSTPQHRSIGVEIGPDIVEKLYSSSRHAMGWRGHDDYSFENRSYRSVLEESIPGPRMLWSGEEHTLVQEIADRFSSSSLRQWAFGGSGIESSLKQVTNDTTRAILIPPKRNLDLRAKVAVGNAVQADGSQLTAHLFFAKNQPAVHPDRKMLDRVREAFGEISAGYRFDIFLAQDGFLDLVFASAGGDWIPAAACGLGLQDLLVLLFFCETSAYNLVCIEEPESHLHPDMQRRLLAYLKGRTDRQFFVSTHSSVFLDNAYVDRVFFTSFTNEVLVDDATSRASLLDDLGYSVVDNLVSDLIVLVEGPSDTPVLEELLYKMGVLGKYDIKFWPLGGDIMDQVDLSVFAQRYKILALVDKDPKSARVRRRFAEKCRESGIALRQLKRNAIENYFTVPALRAVFGGQIPLDVTSIAPNQRLDEQIGINVKRNNRRVARAMSLTDLAGSDLLDFLHEIQEACRDSNATRRAGG